MLKKELRKLYKEKRLALTTKEKLKLDDLLLIQFQHLSFAGVQVLMNYFPLHERNEMNTELFSRYLMHLIPGLQVCYPVTDMITNTMTPVLFDEQTSFSENTYGLIEPVNGIPVDPHEIDMIFVPLLAVDKQGYRVGYGKGFYDRFLIQCSKDALSVGFSYFDPIDKIDDTNQFDVPLNYCITPKNVYEF